MENREVISWLTRIRDRLMPISSQQFEALTIAITAMEKQEKKPAKAKYNRRYNKFVYFCPVCGEVTGKYDFCSECGQAIDYDNTEPYTEEEDGEQKSGN